MKKKNKVCRPRKIVKRQHKPLPLIPPNVAPTPANIAAFSKEDPIDTKSGLVSILKEGKGLELLKQLYDRHEKRFLRTDGLEGINEELKGKAIKDTTMIKDNTLLTVELDLINELKEKLETTLDEIRKLQRKTEILTLQIKWLETGLKRWVEPK
jgi:hypothetical protein